MNDKKIKVGIIGVGRMGITHYAIINSHPSVDIVAVVDTSSTVLGIMQKYLHGIKTYTDYKEMFEKEGLDAVIICTPPGLHYPISEMAALHKVSVFCEKPFTTKKALAEELSKQFSSARLVNQVGYVNRFNDIFKTVKAHVNEGVIGDIINFKSEMFSRTIIRPDEGKTWRNSRESGGGALFEMASHAIDLVNYIVGKPDKVSGSNLTRVFSSNVEDVVLTTFHYQKGISGTLHVNWSDESYRKPTNKIEIFGTKGKIQADQHGYKIYLKKANPALGFREGWNARYITDVFKPVPFYVRGNEFTEQLYHFVENILGKQNANLCSFKDATAALEVIEGIFEDYEKNNKF